MTVLTVKKSYFSTRITSAQCCPAELFRVVRGLLQSGTRDKMEEPLAPCCDLFAKHFANKIARIWLDLDSGCCVSGAQNVLSAPPSLFSLDQFQLLQTENVDKVLGGV